MDRLAIFGVLVALVAIVGGYVIEGGAASALFHLPALFIVFGGTFGAVMLQSPHHTFVAGMSKFKYIWRPNTLSYQDYQAKILHWADVSRQKGFLPLEQYAASEQNPFVKKGLTMLIDGVDFDVIQDALELEVEIGNQRENEAAGVWDSLGGYSPTIGIIGAVLGLIQAMGNIDDPNSLGAGIATAFVATIYGVGAANLFFIPIGEKLKAMAEEKVRFQHMIIQGLHSVSIGENPVNIERKLNAFTLISR
jgi:chemotaxis protein MotA